MFSTPQSKAFFTQQIIKNKIISDEISIINLIHENVWDFKCKITESIKILSFNDEACQVVNAQRLVNQAYKILEESIKMVINSNKLFDLEFSLRDDLKNLEQIFFKTIMNIYQEKIKELKNALLMIEHDVQQLEQKGYLPFVDTLNQNSIITPKFQNTNPYFEKVEVFQKLFLLSKKGNLQNIIISIVKSVINKKESNTQFSTQQQQSEQLAKQVLNVSQYIESPVKQTNSESKNNRHVNHKNHPPINVIEMLKVLQNWQQVNQMRIKKIKRDMKGRIESLNHSNKILKENIKKCKRVMSYEEKEVMARTNMVQFPFQEVGDYLLELNEDLKQKMSKRNTFLVISNNIERKRSKSCIHFNQQKNENKEGGCLKQMDSNLNDSFLDKCNYLISDRFMEDDQNEELIL